MENGFQIKLTNTSGRAAAAAAIWTDQVQQASCQATHKLTGHSPIHFPVASLAAASVHSHRKLPSVLTHFSSSPVHLSVPLVLHSSMSVAHLTPSQPALQVQLPFIGSHDSVLISMHWHISAHSTPKKKLGQSEKERTNMIFCSLSISQPVFQVINPSSFFCNCSWKCPHKIMHSHTARWTQILSQAKTTISFTH